MNDTSPGGRRRPGDDAAGRRTPEGLDPDGEDVTWILGSSRSGSTWLLRMLSEHPRVAPVNETHIGHHLAVWRPISLAWAASESTRPLSTMLEAFATHDDYVFAQHDRERWLPALRTLLLDTIEASVRRWQAGPDRPRSPSVVVKEPSGSEVAELLVELLPASKLLFLLRDGRDVVSSWLAAYRPGGWILDEGGFELDASSRRPFIAWQADVWCYRVNAVQRAFDALPPERRLLVRYEDLVATPHTVVGEILDFLGEPYTAADLERAVDGHALAQVPADERGALNHIRFGRPGRWAAELTDDEQALLTDRLGSTLRRFGYR